MLRQRFRNPPHPEAAAFGSSVEEDRALLPYDILASAAHVRMLVRQKLLPAKEGRALLRELARLHGRALQGKFRLDASLEDVHMNVEAALTKELGEVGAKLPTGRSRNDLVATDLVLFLRENLLSQEEALLASVTELLRHSRGPEGKFVYPSATHLQDAQQVYLAQILQVHAHRFLRDAQRLEGIRSSLRYCPLGAGAVAGSSLPLDPVHTARLLGFQGPYSNSMDAVSDRDASVEALQAAALLGVHLSSLAEEWVLWSTSQFARVRFGDDFVTTSSLMPHKRNPDLAELLRAEAGVLSGFAHSEVGILKGLPLAYNRDLQTGKRVLLEGMARSARALRLLVPLIRSATFLPQRTGKGASTASVELANALVTHGVPFRTAHGRVADFVRSLEEKGKALPDATKDDWTRAFPELGPEGWDPPEDADEAEMRKTSGGSSWTQVSRDQKLLHAAVIRAQRQTVRERHREARLIQELLRT